MATTVRSNEKIFGLARAAQQEIEIGVEYHSSTDESYGVDPFTQIQQADTGSQVERPQHKGVLDGARQCSGVDVEIATLLAIQNVVIPNRSQRIGIWANGKYMGVNSIEYIVKLGNDGNDSQNQ
ncbi:MAG: hypothetical protein ACLQUY_04665 [Ktedonobacterales bacterium]